MLTTTQIRLTQFGYTDMAKKGRTGKKVCWEYGKGKYCGTLISSKETSTHRYARTENGKIKSLPKDKK
jgi:hypothetical protein